MPSIILAKKANVDANTEALETLEGRVDNIVGQTGDSNTEIVDARYSPVTGVTHTVLTDRITSVENELLTKDTASVTEYASVAELGDTVADSVVDGKLSIEQKGITITNMVNGASIADAGTVSFDTITGDKYYDTLNETIITGDGTTKTATNSSGATADMAIYHLNALGLQAVTDTSILADLLPYVSGTKSVPRLAYRVVGINRFDKSKATLDFKLDTDGSLVASTGDFTSDYMMVEPGEEVVGLDEEYAWFDKSKTFISYGTSAVAITAPNNARFLRVSSAYSGIDTFQIESGGTATTYKAYKDDLRFFDYPLRGVPAIKDTIKSVPDGFEHTKNVGKGALGVELVTNGTFDSDTSWIKGTGWSISGGVASCDGTQTGDSDLRQDPFTIGKLVVTTFDISVTAGALRVYYAGAGGGSVSLTSGGSYKYYGIVATNTTLYLRANTDFVGTVDNVSVKEIDISDGIPQPLSASLQDQVYADGANGYYQLATPETTHIPMPGLSSVEGGSIQRFPAQRIQQEYGTGVTFSENVLSVIKATKISGGETVDITDDAVISGTGVTFSPAPNATDPVDVRSELDVDAPIGQLDYTVPINRASLMTDTAEKTRENSNDIYDLQEQIDLLIIATA